MAISYNGVAQTIDAIFRATSGGTVFSGPGVTAVFDYFTDTAVLSDAIYFGANKKFSDLTITVGTAQVGSGITITWEYWNGTGWVAMTDVTDNSAAFTATGVRVIQFPWQIQWRKQTVNGYNLFWIRARITAITSISEGGANSTTAPAAKDGIVDIDGYTDASSCSFTALYNWLVANAPQVNAYKRGKYFEFRQCGIRINSRLKSFDEYIVFGGGQYLEASDYTLDYIHMGTKITNSIASSGSTIELRAFQQSTSKLRSTSNTLCYDSTFKNGTDDSSGTTYLGLTAGEFIGCTFAFGLGMFSGPGGTFNNCNFRNLYLLLSSITGTTFTNCSFSAGGSLVYLYNVAFTMSGLNHNAGSSSVFYVYHTNQNLTFNLDDCVTPLPSVGSTIAPVKRQAGDESGGSGFDKVWFYDASAGTYTDYTTACSNATSDDVPINGDVGDIIYFGDTTFVSYELYGVVLTPVCNNASNDYEYVWEVYANGAWRTVVKTWDTSANFTRSTYNIYHQLTGLKFTSLTINSFTALWFRLRIVTKGTGSPTLSSLKWGQSHGVSEWVLYERYTENITVLDKTGNPIVGATVTFTDTSGAVTSVMSGAGGVVPSQILRVKKFFFDPMTYPKTNHQINEYSYNPYILTVSANGYATYTQPLTISPTTKNMIIQLDQKVGYAYAT